MTARPPSATRVARFARRSSGLRDGVAAGETAAVTTATITITISAVVFAGALAALSALFALAGCTSDSAPPPPPPVRRELGMNDVTILLPLPTDPAKPQLLGLGEHALISRELYASLLATPGDIAPKTGGPIAYEQFHAVALRFDLCDRHGAVACTAGQDGVLRLVLQPMYLGGGEVRAHDIALHAFYPIAAAELTGVVAELRALAQLQVGEATAPLRVSPALSAAAEPTGYREQLRALILRYAVAERVSRLTVFGQDANSVAFAWILRGVERAGPGAPLLPIVIPELTAQDGLAVTQQSVRLGGGDTIFVAEPIADAPAGFALALNGPSFAVAAAGERRAAVAALVAIQNPLLRDTGNTQCLGCHVATFLTPSRAASAGLDAAAFAERFTSSYDLSAGAGVATADARVLRGLGWAAALPVISQRVANETAQVLTELTSRFPP